MITDALGSEAEFRAFLGLPMQLYCNDPNYVAEPAEKTRRSILRERFDQRQKIFLYRREEAPLARVVARISPVLADEHGAPLGMLGFFEAHPAPDATSELLSAAVTWLREQGAGGIVGPLDGDTWHRYRFNVGPFDRPPFLMEPYNKPYYGPLWEQAGFKPLENYYSMAADARAAAAALANIYHRVVARGYRLRPLVLPRFEEEMDVLYGLSTEIFAENFLYEQISREDFLDLYRPARSLIDPELVLIAESAAGDPVGFVFSLVDYHQAVVAMRGGQGLWAKLRFLRHRHRANAVNIKSLGVVPDHRRSGLAAALMGASYETILRKGFAQANLCLIRDGNPSGRLDGGVGSVSRRYVLYQYSGEQVHGS